ncbi:MAG: allophanate hydrolase, partial [Solirubrobacteraceae bacterium]|nr:allophanate hydrolase [Solirubrobacteraceae bacterium]
MDPTSETATDQAPATAGSPESIGAVLGRVRLGQQTVAESALAALARADGHGAPASALFPAPGSGAAPAAPEGVDVVWIDRLDEVAVEAGAMRAELAGPHARLLGVPVAVKGNIDVEGLPTTAACPTFAAGPAELSATAVRRLEDAGAVVLGTTNLDQFATGLNGTRSPYGAPHAVGHPGYVSGGSSSGSAVAVARGDVPLALGTDTAGSGRVPAALNGIVGLKPSKGLVSTAGVLPACRSQDVVSIFAADVDSAALALDVLAGPDPTDHWSRHAPTAGTSIPAGLFDDPTVTTDEALAVRGAAQTPAAPGPAPVPARSRDELVLGIPASLAVTAADEEASIAWEHALRLAKSLPAPGGVRLVPIDLAPFLEAGAMLYGSAFVAERYASVGAFIEAATAAAGADADPALDPTVASIVLAGAEPTAAEAFAAIDRMRELVKQTHAVLAEVDALLTPTVMEHPTHEEMAADPIGVNARLGTFTTFGNLLDLSVLAVPSLPRMDGLPFGVSFHALPFAETRLLRLGARWERAVREAAAGAQAEEAAEDRVLVAVGGAHMAGLPANPELIEAGGEYVRLTRTDTDYRLHVLDTSVGPRPGIERFAGEGPGVEVEVWSVPATRLGWFAGKVPPGLAIGPMTLLDGSTALGFVAAGAD